MQILDFYFLGDPLFLGEPLYYQVDLLFEICLLIVNDVRWQITPNPESIR